MKSKLEIYALSVCFASVICLVISLGIGSYAVIAINAPSLTMNSIQYDQYQLNKHFWEFNKFRHCSGKKCENIEKPSESKITEQREAAFAIAKKGESRKSFQTLIRSSLFILFSALALFIHWRIARNSREQ